MKKPFFPCLGEEMTVSLDRLREAGVCVLTPVYTSREKAVFPQMHMLTGFERAPPGLCLQ